jgi:hypothetical protein
VEGGEDVAGEAKEIEVPKVWEKSNGEDLEFSSASFALNHNNQLAPENLPQPPTDAGYALLSQTTILLYAILATGRYTMNLGTLAHLWDKPFPGFCGELVLCFYYYTYTCSPLKK